MSKAFEVLGLPDTATPDEVKAKWRKLSMANHPDQGGDADKFDEIRKAYKKAFDEASEPKTCQSCNGSGKVARTYGFSSANLVCPTCGGSGRI